jgi:Holliday junction resolvase RusA-like endonuclease
MSGAITITISGEPVAKGRPRMTRRGITYTPAATRKFEAHGRLAAQLAMDGRPPIAMPVRAEIVIDLPVPASWSGKRRDGALRGEIRSGLENEAENG